ncbi:MAG: trypsin-like peptidase domain-containing protein [Fuerstiella sp.]|nr:trypsin-like peptidase domain-containing protein [Fuerstiella sp.]
MSLRVLSALSIVIVSSHLIANESPEVTRRTLDTVDREARKQRTAIEAFRIYQQFQHANDIPTGLRERFESRFSQWKHRADKGLVRLGTKWVTVKKRNEVAAEARKMVDVGLKLIESGDKDGARLKWLEASHYNRNAIFPDFLLGLFNSGEWHRDSVSHPEHAIKHFRAVLKRAPTHIGALNNLAVAYLKEGEVNKAVRYWEDVEALSPNHGAVKHNVTRVLFESKRRAIDVKPATLAKLRDMYDVDDAALQLEETELVWALSHPLVPDIEQDDENPRQNELDMDQVATAGVNSHATGFVVADGYVLTNRHVIEDDLYGTADVIRISSHGINEGPIAAETVAVSDKYDLALLKCPEIKASALALTITPPRLADEVMIVGYREGDSPGRNAKTALGVIRGLSESSIEQLVYDATTNRGNSGGPVFGEDGGVIAVHANGFHIGKPVAAGIPARHAIEFVASQIPDFTGVPHGSEKSWLEIAETARKSTVFITVVYTDAAPQLAYTTRVDKRKEFFADPSCAHCKGWGKVICTNPKCSKGGIFTYKKYRKIIDVNKIAGVVTEIRSKRTKSRCPTCSGSNAVTCGFCDGDGIASARRALSKLRPRGLAGPRPGTR